MNKGDHILIEKEVKSVEKLLRAGIARKDIAEIMNISTNSVDRIARGEHYLQKKPPKTDLKSNKTQLDRIEQKLDELLILWR